MRFARVLGLLVAFLLLGGCSSPQKALEAKDIDFTFSCKMDVSCSGENYVCAFERAGRKDASVEILSGKGQGLKWYWNGGGFCQSYRGLSAESETCTLPDGAFAAEVVKALDCAESPNALEKMPDNTFSGTMSGCGFTLTADGGTGRLQTLAVPDWSITVRFHDFREPVLKSNL